MAVLTADEDTASRNCLAGGIDQCRRRTNQQIKLAISLFGVSHTKVARQRDTPSVLVKFIFQLPATSGTHFQGSGHSDSELGTAV